MSGPLALQKFHVPGRDAVQRSDIGGPEHFLAITVAESRFLSTITITTVWQHEQTERRHPNLWEEYSFLYKLPTKSLELFSQRPYHTECTSSRFFVYFVQ